MANHWIFFVCACAQKWWCFFLRLVCLWNLSNLQTQFRWVICDNYSIGRHGHNRRRRRRRWFSESDRLNVSLCAKWWWYSQDGSFSFSVWDGFSCGYLFFLFFQGKLVFFLFIYFILYFLFFFEKTKPWTISSRYRHLFDFWLLFF